MQSSVSPKLEWPNLCMYLFICPNLCKVNANPLIIPNIPRKKY